MANKKENLLQNAKAKTRKPNLKRFEDLNTDKQGYRIVPISLYSNEANWIDEITERLKKSGYPKANRSMVVREAISALQNRLKEKETNELFDYFIEQTRIV